MTEMILELLKEINIMQLVAIGIMFWFLYNRLDGKINKLDEKLDGKINKLDEKLDGKINKLDEKLDWKISKLDEKIDKAENSLVARIDKLCEKVEDIDRRLCRIEGSLTSHGHCLFNQSEMKKAE